MTATATLDTLQAAKIANLPATAPLPGPRDVAVMPGFNSAQSWDLAQRIGKAFAASTLVPAQYQGNLANCIVALEMANRMGASPLMVMQNLYIVHGNPGWSSKFLVASFNQCGRFSALRYEFVGKPGAKDWGCRAWAVEKVTGEKLVGATITITMADAEGWSTKSGSKWKTMPEQMLMYRAAAFFVRAYAPEISMGLRSVDEIEDGVIDAPPGSITSIEDMQHGGTLHVLSEASNSQIEPQEEAAGNHIDPADNPEAGAETVQQQAEQPRRGPQRGARQASDSAPRVTYAQLADRLQKASDRDVALLVLDEGRGLPSDQQRDLQRVFEERFPEQE